MRRVFPATIELQLKGDRMDASRTFQGPLNTARIAPTGDGE
jgi:hypothetical protein